MKKSQFFFKITILFFLFLISINCNAQGYDPDKVNKKAADFYSKAYDEAIEGKYAESLADLAKAESLQTNFVDVYLSRAGIYANLHDYKKSVTDFEKGMSLDYEYAKTYLLPYSISLAGTGDFEKALIMVNKFLEKPTLNEQSKKAGAYRKSVYEFAIKEAKENAANAYSFSRHNLGDSINSTALEYFPSLTIDGKKMIFTRRQNNDEDFYESNFDGKNWSKAVPVEGKINTNFNEGAQNISQDGDWLIFTGCNYPEGAGSCDLYISYKTKNGKWTEPENLGNTINTEFWESSPSLSPDKKDLYFSSGRPGGYGGKDIYVCHRNQQGLWSRPYNLGPTVNTSGDEGCPFIHADNQTLYFNSNGHPGYGMTDLFMARKTSDIDTDWSTPKNLGYPINTIDDEGSLIVSSDGKTGYYASDGLDTKGGLDLYSFTLPTNVQALKTLWVKGQVYDVQTKLGLPSLIELKDVANGNTISRLQTDEDGKYLVTLPEGKDYAFTVNRKAYLFYSDNFSMKSNVADSPLVVNIGLQPLVKGSKIILKNIFFDVGKTELKIESKSELDNVVTLMNENPLLKIIISGFTDNVGKPGDNITLSIGRAKSVIHYLQSKGIDPKRLSAKGFGETNSIAGNDTESGRALNRRTELMVQ